MARKPNYAFERNNRTKAKAAKREAKRQSKIASKSRKADAGMFDSDTDTQKAPESREDEAPGRFRSDSSPKSE